MGGWNAVVDVSNVCWDEQLPPVGKRRPAWWRLRLVMAAWRAAHGDDARFRLVADDSLVHHLDEAREFGRLVTLGKIAVRPVADLEILDLADKLGLHVLTRDHYLDHRRTHRWIEQSPQRFHRWQVDRGAVTIVPLGITTRSPQELSMRVELKDLQQHKLDPRSPRYRAIIETRWQCGDTQCPESAQWQGQLLVLPKVTARGEPRCPTCGGKLTDLGRRERLHEIVVSQRSGEEILRFPVEAGSPVIVGRGLTLKGVNLQVDGLDLSPAAVSAIEKVSRRHLTITVQEPLPGRRRMVVTDLGSSNGTVVERPPGEGRPRRLREGEPTVVLEKDRVILGEEVLLRFSGKQYVTAAGGNPRPAFRPTTGPRDAGGGPMAGPDIEDAADSSGATAIFRPGQH